MPRVPRATNVVQLFPPTPKPVIRLDPPYLADLLEWRLIGEQMSGPQLAAAVASFRGSSVRA